MKRDSHQQEDPGLHEEDTWNDHEPRSPADEGQRVRYLEQNRPGGESLAQPAEPRDLARQWAQ